MGQDRQTVAQTLPRLKASVWVAAYLRRCVVGGAFASISRKGDDSAGAIFVECLHERGVDLFAPRPGAHGQRDFERVMAGATGQDVALRIESEVAFDPDLWLVTVEDRAGRHFLLADEHG